MTMIYDRSTTMNRIGDVMVSMVNWSVVARGLSLCRVKPDYEIGICCFSAKHAALRRKSKTCWLRI